MLCRETKRGTPARRGLTPNVRIGALLILFFLAGFCPLSAQSPLLHKPAPMFERIDLKGQHVDLKALRGKVVLLNFWASWCGPCQVELPQFQAWQRKYNSAGFQVIAISMDDEEGSARAVVHKLSLDIPVVMGDERLGKEYGGILGLPVTFLIDREARVTDVVNGAVSAVAMEARVRSLLGLR